MTPPARNGYVPVNGLDLYYEIAGQGDPLVYLPNSVGFVGQGDLPTQFRNRSVISVDLQGLGRTADIDRPRRVETDAADVAALLRHLDLGPVDLLGECSGGIVATVIASRYPPMVRRLATYGTVFGPGGEAFKPELLATLAGLAPDSPAFRFAHEKYDQIAPNPAAWPVVWRKVVGTGWSGFETEELTRLQKRMLIAVGDQDWVRLEHSLETFRRIPRAELAVIPDAGHFVLSAEPRKVVPIIEAFLDAPANRLPFGTTETGYYPGVTR